MGEDNTQEYKMELVVNESNLFGENIEDKIRKNLERANERKEKISTFSNEDLERSKRIVTEEVKNVMNEWPVLFGQDPTLYYIHVDLDSFYASCEMLCDPSLRNQPLGVGSMMMLATCNYNARKYGIKAGMPGYIAKRLCPQLIIVKCDFPKYNSFSDRVMEVLEKYDSNLEVYGLDEACLIFDSDKLFNALRILSLNENSQSTQLNFSIECIEKVVYEIRHDVHKTTGLTISAGISVCRGIAKLCSDLNKPNGQFTLKDNYEDFLNKLKVDEINGIGKYTRLALETTFGIKTIQNMKDKMHLINLIYPYKTFINLLRLSYGLITFDYSEDLFSRTAKGIAQDISFPSTESYKFLCETLWLISKDLHRRLSAKDLFTQIITIKIRFDDFHSMTKQRKLKSSIKTDIEIFDHAYNLFMELFTDSKKCHYSTFYLERPINLLGIRLTNLFRGSMRDSLFKFNNAVKIKHKICSICDKELLTTTEIGYEKHILRCIKKEKKIIKKSIVDYMEKKTEINEG